MFREIPANNSSIKRRKPVFGVGINDADYVVQPKINGKQIMCPYYSRWYDMLKRCYDPREILKRPTYSGCSVCDKWLIFSNFKRWMEKQDWKDKHLDKDILKQGNNIYSESFCVFVHPRVNTLLLSCQSARGELPRGVHLNKETGQYVARVQTLEGRIFIGSYKTPEKAYDAYKAKKMEVIKEVALSQGEPVKSALLSYVIT